MKVTMRIEKNKQKMLDNKNFLRLFKSQLSNFHDTRQNKQERQ